MMNLNSIFASLRLTGLGILLCLTVCSRAYAQNMVVKKGNDFQSVKFAKSTLQPTPTAFYDYSSTTKSSRLSNPYSRCNETILFLFRNNTSETAEQGIFLMLLHNNSTCESSGAAEFTFEGIPGMNCNDVIRLDDSEQPNLAENDLCEAVNDKLKITWNWGSNETDGMILRLSSDPNKLPNNFNLIITPRYGNSIPGGWGLNFLTDTATPSYINFGINESITITTAPQLALYDTAGNPLCQDGSSPCQLNFASVPCNEGDVQTVVLKNVGGAPLTLSNILTGFEAFQILENTVPPNKVLNSQETLRLMIKFQSDSSGSVASALTIESNDPITQLKALGLIGPARNEPGFNFSLTYPNAVCGNEVEITGTIPSEFKLNRVSFDKELSRSVMISNDTQFNAVVKITDGPNSIKIIGVAKNSNGCRVTVEKTITVTKDKAQLALLNQSGNALSELVFASVPCNQADIQTVVLKNEGGCPLRLGNISVDFEAAFQILNKPAINTVLEAHRSLELRIRFQSDSSRQVSGKLSIPCDDPAEPEKKLGLVGPVRNEPGFVFTSLNYPAITCADEVEINGTISSGFRLKKISIDKALSSPIQFPTVSQFRATVRLALNKNEIKIIGVAENSNGCRSTSITMATVEKQTSSARVIINEILYDPIGDDFGIEKIELKNVFNQDVQLENWGLWIKHSDREIFWTFPHETFIASKSLLVVHWLADGTSDSKMNIFTSLPNPEDPKGFSSTPEQSQDLLLGGLNNDEPFAIALVQSGGIITVQNDACRVVDFVQFGGRVSPVEDFAVLAGLWRSDNFIFFPFEQGSNLRVQEGFSHEFDPRNAHGLRTESKDFYRQATPSIGRENFLDETPLNHLVISEVCVRPGFAEFIEIFNPDDPKLVPKPDPIVLDDYYITDSGSFIAGSDTIRNNYTNIVKDRFANPNALRINTGDFMVRFPKGAKIGPGNYQTIALRSEGFTQRFPGTKPTYEIVDTDADTANNMINVLTNKRITKSGGSAINLNDDRDEIILFKWVEFSGRIKPDSLLEPVVPDSSDLVKDVDYVFWGPTSTVDKTPLCIDGLDFGTRDSCYKADTPPARQVSINKSGTTFKPHDILKSWQRPQTPREFGEKLASGNGISGHNETSENLALAFKQTTPSPSAKSGELDLQGIFIFEVKANPRGRPNKFVNIDETINLRLHLKNLGSEKTGILYTVLRSREPSITIGADSVVVFPAIAPGDTAVAINPLDVYQFFVDSTNTKLLLPNQLRFSLFVTEKPLAKQSLSQPAQNAGQEIEFSLVASNAFIRMLNPMATVEDKSLRLNLIVKNDLVADDCFFKAANVKAFINVDANFSAFADRFTPNPKIISAAMCRGVVTAPFNFNIETRQPLDGATLRPLVLVKLVWEEVVSVNGNPPTNTVLFNLDTLDLSQPLAQFKVEGKLTYFNDSAKPIQGAMVKLLQVDNLGNTTVKDVINTDGTGAYKFPSSSPSATFGLTDVGKYKITVNHFGPPTGAVTGTIAETNEDDDRAMELAGLPNLITRTFSNAAGSSVTITEPDHEIILAKIAADMDRDGDIDGVDLGYIITKATNSCFVFPLASQFAVNKDWIFVNPARISAVTTTAFKARDTVDVSLGYFNFNANFAGMAFGDANKSAADQNIRVTTCNKSLTGRITYYFVPSGGTAQNVAGVTLSLTLADGTTATANTSADGTYNFNHITAAMIQGGLIYTLRATKPRDVNAPDIRTAIDGTDLDIGERLDKHRINDPFNLDSANLMLLAADVNRNQVISEGDMDLIGLFMNHANTADIGHTAEWHFIKLPITVTTTTTGEVVTQDFIAILLGDINGSWTTPSGSSRLVQTHFKEHYPFLNDVKAAPGELFTLPLRIASQQNISSAAMELSFDPKQLAIVKLEPHKTLARYRLNHQVESGNLQAILSHTDSVASSADILWLTLRAIGQPGDSSLLVLKDFAVNGAPGQQATAHFAIVKKIPEQFFLVQNYPNPFNPATKIKYGLSKNEQTKLQIFNMMGQVVATLVDQRQEAGYYEVEWKGVDKNSHRVPSGVYFLQLKAGKFSSVRKLMVIR